MSIAVGCSAFQPFLYDDCSWEQPIVRYVWLSSPLRPDTQIHGVFYTMGHQSHDPTKRILLDDQFDQLHVFLKKIPYIWGYIMLYKYIHINALSPHWILQEWPYNFKNYIYIYLYIYIGWRLVKDHVDPDRSWFQVSVHKGRHQKPQQKYTQRLSYGFEDDMFFLGPSGRSQ